MPNRHRTKRKKPHESSTDTSGHESSTVNESSSAKNKRTVSKRTRDDRSVSSTIRHHFPVAGK
ncbi:hypothetical protein BaRGS_00024126, partial [Batillaria attramentaria]